MMSVYLFRNLQHELDSMRSTQLLDQHFGLGLNAQALLTAFTFPSHHNIHRLMLHPNYYRLWKSESARSDSGSTLKRDQEKFQVNLDVQQFAPEEISVKIVGQLVAVEGKHEEKKDEHGLISRQFVRKYALPEGHDIKGISSTLSSDGILTITAPKDLESGSVEIMIPISHTGPLKNITNNLETQCENHREEK